MGAFVGSYLGSYLRQALREAEHARKQKAGHQIVGQRLQITVPWQPEMVNYPSFLCVHCQFPHVLRQTLLGCSACAAPYFPSEVARLDKKGTLTCPSCTTSQSIGAMPFCCINCRCIQGIPSQLDWRRTYSKLPLWRAYPGPAITALIGVFALLVCLLVAVVNRATSSADLTMAAVFFGVLPIVLGGLSMLPILLRKPMPAELMMSCGGVGYRTDAGAELWFSWRDVGGLETSQPLLLMDATAGHPDSMATRWSVRMGQELLVFDGRLDQAREFARQIRMRAPAAPLADLPPVERRNPWLVIILALLVVLVCFGFVSYATHP
jgi:hypothetical protein